MELSFWSSILLRVKERKDKGSKEGREGERRRKGGKEEENKHDNGD